jgi:hypothetical protein
MPRQAPSSNCLKQPVKITTKIAEKHFNALPRIAKLVPIKSTCLKASPVDATTPSPSASANITTLFD